MLRRILAFTLAFLLSGLSLPARDVSLGIVTQAIGAYLNSAAVSVGATLYDGDRVWTDAKGALSLRAGTVQLVLSQDSAVVMKRDESGLTPVLERGSVTFRAEGGEGLRLSAADVRVRPQSSAPTLGQMTLENCAVLVTSRVQALEVTAGKETKIVEEGKSYRVLLGGPCLAGAWPPPYAGQSRFWAIPLLVGAVTAIVLYKALESPDRP